MHVLASMVAQCRQYRRSEREFVRSKVQLGRGSPNYTTTRRAVGTERLAPNKRPRASQTRVIQSVTSTTRAEQLN